MPSRSPRLFPFLWYAKDAEKAARFYVSIFPNSRVNSVTALPHESPSGPPGSVTVVDFTLMGRQMQAMAASTHHQFNDGISVPALARDQKELDRWAFQMVPEETTCAMSHTARRRRTTTARG